MQDFYIREKQHSSRFQTTLHLCNVNIIDSVRNQTFYHWNFGTCKAMWEKDFLLTLSALMFSCSESQWFGGQKFLLVSLDFNIFTKFVMTWVLETHIVNLHLALWTKLYNPEAET